MIVSAANYNFWSYTTLFLQSFIKNSGINLNTLKYFVFDYARERMEYKTNCVSLIAKIINLDPRIDPVIVPFEDMQGIIDKFERLYKSLRLKFFLKTNLMDYLKGYFSKYIQQPYLFLDSDIIVKKQISGLYNTCRKNNKLAMAEENVFDFEIYFNYYFSYAKRNLSDYYISKGALNSGVIFVPTDYTSQWFEIFSKTISLYGVKGHPGQGAWNILFWLKGGRFIQSKYNFCAIQKKQREKAALVHFPLGTKKLMPLEAF